MRDHLIMEAIEFGKSVLFLAAFCGIFWLVFYAITSIPL